MRAVKKNVYYCEFCNKKGLSASHIARHERSCTANPDRECRLCKENRDIKTFIEQLKARFEIKEIHSSDEFGTVIDQEIEWKGKKITFSEILDFTEGCPNCTLAILRQTKLNYSIFGFKYNYKKELQSWWSDINNESWEKERQEMASGIYY